MCNPETHNKWRRRCWTLLALWGLETIAMSFPATRGLFVFPLYVHEENASGEAAYVMADGPASWERLRAASDLYHLKRVKRILILEEMGSNGYNFVQHRSESRVERVRDFLSLCGVPNEAISYVPENESAMLGSRSEAQGVAKSFPDLSSIVIVTSAPHTRRSRLCFERAMPNSTAVQVYSASNPFASDEIYAPIWLEYAKLFIYQIFA